MRMNEKTKPPKKALNVLVDEQLVSDARALKLNVSAVLDRALRDELAKRWLLENAKAFEENRIEVEKNGLWSDGRRVWSGF